MSNAISFWALEVPAGEGPTPMISDIPRHSTTVRITMAAIDPTAAPLKADEPLMATLKIMRRAPNADDYDMSDDEDEEDDEEEDEEEESEDEAPKGKDGKKLSKKEADAAVKKALQIAQANAEKMEVDAEDDEEDDEELEEGDFEVEEITICTLDPKNHYQQTLDLTIDEDDEIFFKVIGNFDVSLSGNYMAPAHDHEHDHDNEDFSESDEDSDYDLSPDEDELYGADSDDELDTVADPRITEVASDEETPKEKKSDKKAEKKSLKRAAEEPAKDEAKPEEKKLSKKQLKKLKANDGKAVDATADTPDKKSVKFAEKLEQGPTSSAEKPKAEKAKPAAKEAASPKAAKPTSTVVQGVVIEDKKVGTGAVAKNGAKLGMRYIGKLQNGKTFDSNTKGKPFNFKLGRGEVIKGWDIGLAGMRIGGERRLTIPPNMAYGKQANAGIPGNSTLIFDVKLLEVK